MRELLGTLEVVEERAVAAVATLDTLAASCRLRESNWNSYYCNNFQSLQKPELDQFI